MAVSCPTDAYCDPVTSTCTIDCLEDGDIYCPAGVCTSDGSCIDLSTICPDGSMSCGQACEGEPDAGLGLCGAPCTGDVDCPSAFYCEAGGMCTRDCIASNDDFCPVGECSAKGHCVDTRGMDGGTVCARKAVPTTEQPPAGSCIFDLAGTVAEWSTDPCSGGSFTIVAMNGNRIPVSCDPTNGWQLTAEDQISLYGTACTTFNGLTGATVDVSFPCNAVVLP